MIEFNNISIMLKQNGREIIKNFNFVLNKDDKIAIIGEEGNGKSTLLKAVMDIKKVEEYAYVTGNIKKSSLKIGYLEQFLDEKWNECYLLDYFCKEDYDSEIDFDKYEKINEIYEGFSKFNINSSLLDENVQIKTLSGGEKVKIQLIKILKNNPDVLLLDEPTNDIDIETLEWLEKFIVNINKPIIYISHDETLLERTANGIIHLEQLKNKTESKYAVERISYNEYVEKRNLSIDKQTQIANKQRAEYESQMKRFNQVYQKVEHQQNVITRADPHGAKLLKKKIKSLKSQQKRFEIEKEDFVEVPYVEEAITFKFDKDIYLPAGKRVIDNLCINELKVNDRILSKDIKLTVNGNEHVVIIGENGAGKTTFIKKIYEILKDRKDIKVGYMSQNYDDMLDLNMTVIEFLLPSYLKEDETKVRTFLGSLKFTNEEMISKLQSLSGGQKAKVLLLKLVIDKCNVLILDEPTRNLSPLSNPVIRKVLREYKGAIISVSHDRKYINEVCNRKLKLTNNGLIDI